jgi:clan AA aspartic protease
VLTGRVTAEREAVVSIQVLGPAGQAVLVEAAIDTGYNGFFTFPSTLIRDLALPFVGITQATLGDGNDVSMEVFQGTVVWEALPREVLVLAADGGALMGMAMLGGSRVVLDVEDDGLVTIEPMGKARRVH